MRDQAEQLKCGFGIAFADMAEDEEIQIPGIGGRNEKTHRQEHAGADHSAPAGGNSRNSSHRDKA